MTGTYEHSLDAKGRLFIPAKLREELGVSFYLAILKVFLLLLQKKVPTVWY